MGKAVQIFHKSRLSPLPTSSLAEKAGRLFARGKQESHAPGMIECPRNLRSSKSNACYPTSEKHQVSRSTVACQRCGVKHLGTQSCREGVIILPRQGSW